MGDEHEMAVYILGRQPASTGINPKDWEDLYTQVKSAVSYRGMLMDPRIPIVVRQGLPSIIDFTRDR